MEKDCSGNGRSVHSLNIGNYIECASFSFKFLRTLAVAPSGSIKQQVLLLNLH